MAYRKILLVSCFLLLTINSAHAQEVFVKYRGLVDLSNFYCPSIKPSSVVNNICYDQQNEYLLVQLNRTYYHYCEVPLSVFSDWIDADSLGRYYKAFVKGNYSCRLSKPPEY